MPLLGIGQTVVVAVGTLVCLVAALGFIHHEMETLGKSFFKNKFVIIIASGSLMAFFEFLTLMVFSGYFQHLWIFKVSLIFYALVAACHVALVYIRSKALTASGGFGKYFLVLKVICYSLAVLVSMVIIEFIIDSAVHLPIILVFLTVIPAGVLYMAVDLMATVAFGMYVREVNAGFQKQDSYVSTNTKVHMDQTDLIAARGCKICLLSSLSFILFWIAMAMSFDNPKLGIASWIYIVQKIISLAVLIMWMKLKIDLDAMLTRTKSLKAVSSSTPIHLEGQPQVAEQNNSQV
eukprot:TRINITY_DN1769_c0_g1_i5.p1 TRINITY_DN1769_c0_g1~~TRINITY_DN1769_c0_g1_i5.p1  ORF type:complete len:292 (+),score=57.28 TRINITY_DN1769_c0_g1_i5:40-915(+)